MFGSNIGQKRMWATAFAAGALLLLGATSMAQEVNGSLEVHAASLTTADSAPGYHNNVVAGKASGSESCTYSITISPGPNPPSRVIDLNAVAAISANDVWALGASNTDPLAEHWDGTAWSIITTPTVHSDSVFKGVSAVSSSDVWGVGTIWVNGYRQGLIEHWNGSTWSIFSSPAPQDYLEELYGVSARAANDVWAVGSIEWDQSIEQRGTVIAHYDGSAWTAIYEYYPVYANAALKAVSALAANDVWAVGTEVKHYDGSSWRTDVGYPYSGGENLNGVYAFASNDVWVVGSYRTDRERTRAVHYDGSTWQVVASPDQGSYGSALHGVYAFASNDVWAVGSYQVGADYYPRHTLIEHYDGAAWSIVASPNLGAQDNALIGVSALATNDVWAVGTSDDTATPSTTLVEHIVGTCAPSCPVQFTDVQRSNTFYANVRCLACRNVISGYPCGGSNPQTGNPEPCAARSNPYFRYNNPISRGQISKLVSNAANFTDDPGGQLFEDVPSASPFYPYINRLVKRNVMSGYACGGPGEPCVAPANLPYFRSGQNALRAQLSKIVSNAAGFSEAHTEVDFQDVPQQSPFYVYVQRLVSRGVLGGYPCGGAGEPCVAPGNLPYFRPSALVSRGQSVRIAGNAFYPNCQTP